MLNEIRSQSVGEEPAPAKRIRLNIRADEHEASGTSAPPQVNHPQAVEDVYFIDSCLLLIFFLSIFVIALLFVFYNTLQDMGHEEFHDSQGAEEDVATSQHVLFHLMLF